MLDNRFRGLCPLRAVRSALRRARIPGRPRAGGNRLAAALVVRVELLLRLRGERSGRFGPLSGNPAERDLPERPLTPAEHRAWLRLSAALRTGGDAGRADPWNRSA